MLETLGKYKELLAILVFFLSGFFWLNSTFPKNTDLARLECLVRNYMELTQLQTAAIAAEDQINEFLGLIESGRLTPPMAEDFNGRIEDLRARHRDHRNRMSEIRQSLERHECDTPA